MSEWISVDKRLPDEQKEYLVFIPGEYKNNIMVARFAFNHRTGWRGAQAHSAIEDVTHWMELPEEPEW